MSNFGFSIEKRLGGDTLARAGKITTPHGVVQTPAFIPVGTKATVKALRPEDVVDLGAQAVLANTYHLYLAPGDELLRDAGGVGKFMHWGGPTFTDSGGFQVFSLGAAFGKGVGKVAKGETDESAIETDGRSTTTDHGKLATIDEEGVTFKSHQDGSTHRFTPEHSMQIQHNLGGDITFAFDECTSPTDSEIYQKEALDRTHRWAKRSLDEHKRLGVSSATKTMQALYGVVQGGRFQSLREESARVLGAMEFDGFGIGGSFTKDDIGTAVRWVNSILPEDKSRHLLGIGEPVDLFLGVENGVDTFDCVAPTRMGRNAGLYTKNGRINLNNAQFVRDFAPVEEGCDCYTCTNFTRAYLSHLFRSEEMLAATLASIHNLRFIVRMTDQIRMSILDGTFAALKEKTLVQYYGK